MSGKSERSDASGSLKKAPSRPQSMKKIESQKSLGTGVRPSSSKVYFTSDTLKVAE